MIFYPCVIDNEFFNNTREAHRTVFLPKGISYFRLQRALRHGRGELCGHTVKRITPRYEIGEEDSDGADLVALPAAAARKTERAKGQPLINYPPGGSPLERGIIHWK